MKIFQIIIIKLRECRPHTFSHVSCWSIRHKGVTCVPQLGGVSSYKSKIFRVCWMVATERHIFHLEEMCLLFDLLSNVDSDVEKDQRQQKVTLKLELKLCFLFCDLLFFCFFKSDWSIIFTPLAVTIKHTKAGGFEWRLCRRASAT